MLAIPLHSEVCPVQFHTSTYVQQRQGESLANQGNSKVRERVKKESQFPGALNFHHIVIVPSGKKLYNDGDDWLLKRTRG